MGVGSEKVRCDMSIDIDEMVRMAGERAGWVYSDGMIYEPYIGSKEEERNHTIAVIKHVSEGEFIARAPKTIAYLAARVRVLQAQNAALQARADALGEWLHPHAELPPMTDGYRSEIVVVATEAQYHYKENRWILNSEPFGWKAQLPDPDESPTAAAVAESESEE